MASGREWMQGARPRTLPNAIAPVVAGTGAAIWDDGAVWWKAILALVVAVAFVVGVNFANDYSDGIRGTDDERVGPMRLVGSGAASPSAVRGAAFAVIAIAAVAGLVLSLTSAWWLVFVGAGCIAGAWFYTGGTRPYGYSGFGEIAVFVFFGLVGVLGTQFTQAQEIDWVGVVNAVAVGCFSSAVLTTNNLRDIPSDSQTGKTTLAVRLGAPTTRRLHTALVTIPSVLSVVLVAATPWALLGLLATPFAWQAGTPVRSGAQGTDLVPALARTGVAMVAWTVLTTLGLALGAYL